ncbi:Exonuclease 1, partial [Globisporangium splendens]
MASWAALNADERDARRAGVLERATEEAQDAQNTALYEQALRFQQQKQALELDGTDVIVWYQMGKTAMETGKLWLARRLMEEGFQVDGSYWPLVQTLCEVLFEIGDYDEYKRIARHLRDHDPQCPSIKLLDQKLSVSPCGIESNNVKETCSRSTHLTYAALSVQERKLLKRARGRLNHLQEVTVEALKKRKVLHSDLQNDLDQRSSPMEYVLEKSSWPNLGKLLLQVYEDVNSERRNAAAYAKIRITVTDQGESSEPDVVDPATRPTTSEDQVEVMEIDDDDGTTASLGKEDVSANDSVDLAKTSAASGGRKKKNLKQKASSMDASTVALSDNDTQDSGVATSELDEPQPIRRKSRRHEERLREEHAAAAKLALEKNLAYRLEAFLPGNENREQTRSIKKSSERDTHWPQGFHLKLAGSVFQITDDAGSSRQEISSFTLMGSYAVANGTSTSGIAQSGTSAKSNIEVSARPDIKASAITKDHVSTFVTELLSSSQGTSVISNLLRHYLDQCGEWAQRKLVDGEEEIHTVCFWAEKLISGTLERSFKPPQGSIELAMISGHSHSATGSHGLQPRTKLFLLELKFDMLIRNAPHGRQRKKQLKQLSSLIAGAESLLLEFCLMEGTEEVHEEDVEPNSDMVRLFWVLARLHDRSGRASIAKEYYLKCQEHLLMNLPQDKSATSTILLPNQKLDSEICLEILEERISGLQYSNVCSEARISVAGGNYDQAVSLLLGHFFPAKQTPRIADLLHEFESMESEDASDERGLIEIMMESFTKSSTYTADDALLFLVTLLYHVMTFIDEVEKNEENGGVLYPEQIVESGLNGIEFILDELKSNVTGRVVDENCQLLLQVCCLSCIKPSILLLFDSPKDVFQSICSILKSTETNEPDQKESTHISKQLRTIDAVAQTFHMIRSFDETSFRDLFAKLPLPASKKKQSRRDRVRALQVELLRYMNWCLSNSESWSAMDFPSHKKSTLMSHCRALMKEEEDIISRREDKTSRQLFGNAAMLFLLLCASSLSENIEKDRKTLSELVSLLHSRMGQYGICGLNYCDQVGAASGGNGDRCCFLETCIWVLSKYTHASDRIDAANGKSNEVQTESEGENGDEDEDSSFDTEMAQCYLCLYDVHILPGGEDHKTGNSFALLQRDTSTKRPNALRLAQFAFPILLSRPPKNNSQKKENLKLLNAIRESLKDTHSLEQVQTRYRPNELQQFLAPSNLLEWDDGPFPGVDDEREQSNGLDKSSFQAPLDHLWYLLGENYILSRVRRRGNVTELAEMELRVKERISFLMTDVLYYHPQRVKSWIRLGKTMKELYHATSDACAVILGRKRKIAALLEYTSKLQSGNNIVKGDGSAKKFTFKEIVLGMSLFDKMKQWTDKEQAEKDGYRIPVADDQIELTNENAEETSSSFSMEAFAIYYIVQVIEFARRCFAMAAHLANQSLEKAVEGRNEEDKSGLNRPPEDDEEDEEDHEEIDELRNTIVECNEECGLLLYNVLQEFSVVKYASIQLFPSRIYTRVAQAAFTYFQKGLKICEGVEDAEEVRFRLNFMSGKTLKKMRRCEEMKAAVNAAESIPTPEEIIDCFAKAEKAHEDGEMEHALVHAFYALQAMRMELVLSHPVNVPDLRLVCTHYFEEEEEEDEDYSEAEDTTEDKGAGSHSSDDEKKKKKTKGKNEGAEGEEGAHFKMTKEFVFSLLDRAERGDDTALHSARGWLYLNVVDALESIPDEDRYFHPSRYVLSQGVYRMDDIFHSTFESSQEEQAQALTAALSERRNPSGLTTGDALAAERAVKELTPLFDKKRPQIVAIWLSEYVPASKKFEELNQRQMKYDRYRLKYWQFYMQLLEESGAYGKLKEVGTWVLACKEEHDVIDEMLGVVLQARGNVLRARIQRLAATDSVPHGAMAADSESVDSMIVDDKKQKHVPALLKLLAKTYTYYLDIVESQHRLVYVLDNSQELLLHGELLLVLLFTLGATEYPSEFPFPDKAEQSEENMANPTTEGLKAASERIKAALLQQRSIAASSTLEMNSAVWKALLDATRSFCEEKWPERMGKGKIAKSRLRLKQPAAVAPPIVPSTHIATTTIVSSITSTSSAAVTTSEALPVTTTTAANPIEIGSDHEESAILITLKGYCDHESADPTAGLDAAGPVVLAFIPLAKNHNHEEQDPWSICASQQQQKAVQCCTMCHALYARPTLARHAPFARATKAPAAPAFSTFAADDESGTSVADNSKKTPPLSDTSKLRRMRRLLDLYRPEKKQALLATSTLSVSTAITMVMPFGMGKVIDTVFAMDGALHLPHAIGGLSGLFVVGFLASVHCDNAFSMIGERITNRLRQGTYESIVKQDLGFFDESRTGELANRLSADTTVVGKVLSDNVADGLFSVAQAVGSVTMLLVVSPKLAIVMLAIVPPIAIGGVSYGRFVKKLTTEVQKQLSEATEIAEEKLSNIRVVRWFAKESHEIEVHKKKVDEVLALARKRSLASASFFGGVDFAVKMSMLGVLGYGGQMVADGLITSGELTSFLLYTLYVGFSFAGMSSFYSDLMKGIGASTRVFELLEREPRIRSLDSWNSLPESFTGHIQFEDVHFRYPTRPDSEIFHGLNLEVKPNETIALVGPSGCGKSSVTALLARFYELDREGSSGKILLDGVDIATLNPTELRGIIGAVPQEPPLFACSIRDNIAYGCQGDATEEDVIRAAKTANAHDFIMSFPDGYNTIVGERGQALSGGQKQRVAIARALIKEPKILILDEATSALDPESEKLVQDAVDRAKAGRTVILVAHRLSTIRSADRIAVILDGRVAEQGTFDELASKEDSVFSHIILQGKDTSC